MAARNLLMGVQSALVAFVAGDPSPDEIFNDLLGELLSATGSEFGLIAEIAYGASGKPTMRNLALSNISWDEPSRVRYELELLTEFMPCNDDSLIGAAIASGSPYIVNNVGNNPLSTGVPKGHPPIQSFLGVPVFNGEEKVGLIGIANRPSGYDNELVADLGPLVATCGAIICGSRTRQKRVKAEREPRKLLHKWIFYSTALIQGSCWSMKRESYASLTNRSATILCVQSNQPRSSARAREK